MAFRNDRRPGGGSGTLIPGVPTKAIDIGDGFEQGVSGFYADKDHQHAVPGPPPGSAQDLNATGSDGAATTMARSDHTHKHTRQMHEAGGHADLTPTFPTFTAADARYAALLHGARHGVGQPDDLSGLFPPLSKYTAKGGLLLASAAGAVTELPTGAPGTFLQADSTQPGGAKWSTLSSTVYDPASFAIRRSTTPDGVDLSYASGAGVVTPGASSVSVAPVRAFGSGLVYVFSSTTVVNYATRPGSGTRNDSLVLRIDNAAGGPGSATLAMKQGTSGAFPTMTQQDLSLSSTAVYEVELYRLVVPVSGAATVADVRPIAQGLDGQDGTIIKLWSTQLGADAATVAIDNIPQTFRTLQLVSNAKVASGAASTALGVNFNGLSGSFDFQNAQSDGSTATNGRALDYTFGLLGDITSYASDAYLWGAFLQTDFVDYARSDIRKTITSRNSRGIDNAPVAQSIAMLWYNNVAIYSMVLALNGGGNGNIRAGSSFALYGIR